MKAPPLHILLIISSALAALVSYNQLQSLIHLNQFASLDEDQAHYNLFGTDYASYKSLQRLPDDARIAMLIPHDHYRLKSALFLYPRTVEYFIKPSDLISKDLEAYDAVLAYILIDQSTGLNTHMVDQNWQVEDLLRLEELAPNPATTSAQLAQKISNFYGNLLYFP